MNLLVLFPLHRCLPNISLLEYLLRVIPLYPVVSLFPFSELRLPVNSDVWEEAKTWILRTVVGEMGPEDGGE